MPAPPRDITDAIRLEGFELGSANIKRGEPILLLLYWRGLARIENDFVVSVSLIARAGSVVARYEKQPRRGDAPTSMWSPGELVVDAIQLPVPDSAAPGVYRLEIGLLDISNVQMQIELINVIE